MDLYTSEVEDACYWFFTTSRTFFLLDLWSVSCYQVSKQNSSSSVGFSVCDLTIAQEARDFVCGWESRTFELSIPCLACGSPWKPLNNIQQESHAAFPNSCDFTDKPGLGLWLTWNFSCESDRNTAEKHAHLEWAPWAPRPVPDHCSSASLRTPSQGLWEAWAELVCIDLTDNCERQKPVPRSLLAER